MSKWKPIEMLLLCFTCAIFSATCYILLYLVVNGIYLGEPNKAIAGGVGITSITKIFMMYIQFLVKVTNDENNT
jgi:hypothetical protein